MRMLRKFSDIRAKLLENPNVRAVYEKMEPEYELARAIVEARTNTRAGMLKEDKAGASPRRG